MSETRNLMDYAVILHAADNVATALVDIPAGRYECAYEGKHVVIDVAERIAAGFKLALCAIDRSERIYKYGYVIGLATIDIKAGDCVHIHNVSSLV